MTPNTMTIDEVRDELARRDGWTYTAPHKDTETGRVVHGVWSRGKSTVCFHPVRATLDGAAAALRKGWTWMRDGTWWIAVPPGSVSHWNHVKVPDTGDPIADFFRLALSCRIAEEGK